MGSLEVIAILLSGISISASLFYYSNVLKNQTKALEQSREDFLEKKERERPLVELSIIHADLKLTNIQGGTAHNLYVQLTEQNLNKEPINYLVQLPETFLIYGNPMILKNNEHFHAPEGKYIVSFSYTETEIGPRKTTMTDVNIDSNGNLFL